MSKTFVAICALIAVFLLTVSLQAAYVVWVSSSVKQLEKIIEEQNAEIEELRGALDSANFQLAMCQEGWGLDNKQLRH